MELDIDVTEITKVVVWLVGLSGQDPPLGRWLHRFGSHPIGSPMGGTGIRPCCRLCAEDAATRDLEELDERFFVGSLRT